MFSNKKDTNTERQLDMERIPAHIAIIMDGNGRWAQHRHLPRVAGHKQGMQTVKKVTMAASDLGVKVLSLYAFSTENWKRPATEVNYLMQLPIRFFATFVPDLVKHNVKVMVMGDITRLPEKKKKAVKGKTSVAKEEAKGEAGKAAVKADGAKSSGTVVRLVNCSGSKTAGANAIAKLQAAL